jgi:O-antigen/teichoic acid export membrane protein
MRRNVVANASGSGLSAALNLVLIPIALRQLGLEAYGVIAFLASTQVLLSLFDLGLSPALTWAIAGLGGSGKSDAAIKAIWSPYVAIGVLLGTSLFVLAPFVAGRWLQLAALSIADATMALQLGAIAVAMRWPVSLLSAALAGLQRFDALNVAKALHAALSFVGAVVVLYVSPGIVPFAVWLVASALIEVLAYRVALQRMLPHLPMWPLGPTTAAKGLWRYARGVAVVAALSLVLTQSDRLVIAKISPTSDLGRYSVAYTLLFGLSLIPLVVSSAYYPRLAGHYKAGQLRELVDRYRDASQVLIYLYALPFGVCAVFGSYVLDIFARSATSDMTTVVLALLAIGFLMNTTTAMAYVAALATANTRLPVLVNAFNVVWYLPVVVVAALSFGIVGVAAAWALLNASYLLTLVPAVHRRVLREPVLPWLTRSFLPFPLLACGLLLLARVLVENITPDRFLAWVGLGTAGVLYLAIGWLLLGPDLRRSTPLARRILLRP